MKNNTQIIYSFVWKLKWDEKTDTNWEKKVEPLENHAAWFWAELEYDETIRYVRLNSWSIPWKTFSNFDPQEFFSKESKETHKFHLRQSSKLVAQKVEIGHRSTQKSKTDIVRLKNRKRTSFHSKRLGWILIHNWQPVEL